MLSTPQTVKNTLIIARSDGRLANQLFFFANIMAFALERKLEVINPSFLKYARFFSGSSLGKIPHFPPAEQGGRSAWNTSFLIRYYQLQALLPFHKHYDLGRGSLLTTVSAKLGLKLSQGRKRRTTFRPEEEAWASEVADLLKRPKTFFSGFMFVVEEKTMQCHAQAIRDYFQPIAELQQKFKARAEEFGQGEVKVIGVHMRRGDYRVYRNGKYFFDDAQYRRFIEACQLMWPEQRLRFLLFSDEKINEAAFSGLDVMLPGGSAIEDLYLMATCDALLGPPSTYTKWASFMGEVPLLVLEAADQVITPRGFQVYYNHC